MNKYYITINMFIEFSCWPFTEKQYYTYVALYDQKFGEAQIQWHVV